MLLTHLIAVIPTTTTTAAPKVMTLQNLQTLGTSLGGSASLTPFFNGLGHFIKQHPKVKNEWLRWILPLIALVLATSITIGYYDLGYTIDPFTILGIYAMLMGAAFGADVAFGFLNKAGVATPGTNNLPATVVAPIAPTITPVAPVVNPPAPAPLPPSPMLPPSPLNPSQH